MKIRWLQVLLVGGIMTGGLMATGALARNRAAAQGCRAGTGAPAGYGILGLVGTVAAYRGWAGTRMVLWIWIHRAGVLT